MDKDVRALIEAEVQKLVEDGILERIEVPDGEDTFRLTEAGEAMVRRLPHDSQT